MLILSKFENIDRRIIFLLILIAVIVPLIIPIGMDMGVSKPVQDTYDFVEKLPPGSVIWMGFDYYNTTRTECDAQAIAFLRHAFRKNCKVFTTSVIPDSNLISQQVVKRLADEAGKVYGKDYAILGYKSGSDVVILQVCQNIKGLYSTDVYGTPIDEIPIMNKVNSAKDIDMAFTATDNATFDSFVKIASTQYHIPMSGGSTAVSVPLLYVYLDAGQAVGLLGGLKGAAEYEKLIGKKDTATAGMDAQSIVHLLIVVMILMSNVVYFINRRRGTDSE